MALKGPELQARAREGKQKMLESRSGETRRVYIWAFKNVYRSVARAQINRLYFQLFKNDILSCIYTYTYYIRTIILITIIFSCSGFIKTKQFDLRQTAGRQSRAVTLSRFPDSVFYYYYYYYYIPIRSLEFLSSSIGECAIFYDALTTNGRTFGGWSRSY